MCGLRTGRRGDFDARRRLAGLGRHGLHGKTLGLLGLGRLGSQVAQIGRAFGMTPIAWSQNLSAGKAAEHGVRAVTRARLFTESDVLSVHLVLSDRTHGLVGAADLRSMKPTAILVNTSRGPIIDEDALVETLREGRIHRVAIDVSDTEPLPADHPLRSLPNALLTGHVGYVTRELYETSVSRQPKHYIYTYVISVGWLRWLHVVRMPRPTVTMRRPAEVRRV